MRYNDIIPLRNAVIYPGIVMFLQPLIHEMVYTSTVMHLPQNQIIMQGDPDDR